MTRFLLALCVAASMTATAASDDDAPIPYDDDDSAPTKATTVKPKKKKRRPDAVREEDEDEQEGEKSLASADDPNIGVGFEILSGLALLDASKGGVDPRYSFGARFTWEFGRLMSDEYLREMFFADVTWTYAATKDGTDQVNVDTHLHGFTIAPAIAVQLGKSFMSAYAQVGAGFDYSYSVMKLDANPVTLGGSKFLFQYGIGLRGRPAIVADGTIRLVFRIELTRYVRGYMHDMIIGGAVGLIF